MDINGTIQPLAPPAGETSVTRPTATVPPPGSDGTETETDIRDVAGWRGEERAQTARDSFAARIAANTRSGTRFHVDESSRRFIAEILNENNEVIKQIPPEEALRIAARFRQLVGLLFNQQA